MSSSRTVSLSFAVLFANHPHPPAAKPSGFHRNRHTATPRKGLYPRFGPRSLFGLLYGLNIGFVPSPVTAGKQ